MNPTKKLCRHCWKLKTITVEKITQTGMNKLIEFFVHP